MSIFDNDDELEELLEEVEEQSEGLSSYESRIVDYVSSTIVRGKHVSQGLREKLYAIAKKLGIIEE